MAQFHKELSPAVAKCLARAEAGQAEAFYDLGLMYSTGQGVQRDFVAAHKWFNLAAVMGVNRAKADRQYLASEMNPLQIEEAQRQAREWHTRH